MRLCSNQVVKCCVCLIALVFFASVFSWSARADLFYLKSGGQVTGTVIQRGENGEVVVQSNLGAKVTLSRRQISKVVSQDDFDQQYAKKSREMPDTAEAHRELAAWCKKNRQGGLTNYHLKRLIELDPTDEAARLSLGYQQLGGRWMTRDEIMTARGLRRYDDGEYRTPQDIALRESAKRRKNAETDWFRKIRTWVGWLGGRRSSEGAELIAGVKDPLAADAIVKLLKREKSQRIRDLLTATLAELKHPLAVTTLVDFSLHEFDHEVRLQCLDYLLQYHQPVPLQPYINALQNPNNQIVNNGAEALHRFEDPRAISPLIDALVTVHKFKNLNAPIGNTNASFTPQGGGGGSGGGGGLSMGGNKNKIIQRELRNDKVRQALVDLSGGLDYDFNENLWRRWFVNKQIDEYVDMRRDQ